MSHKKRLSFGVSTVLLASSLVGAGCDTAEKIREKFKDANQKVMTNPGPWLDGPERPVERERKPPASTRPAKREAAPPDEEPE
jgi:hypothetical protein